MIKIPHTRQEWTKLGQTVGWTLVRFQVLGMIIGMVLTIFTQLLTGFWEFRATHEDMLRQQWSAVVDAQEQFESKLGQIDTVLRGQPSPTAGTEYASAAQTYIRSMEAISRSLPETSTEIADYIDTIAALRKYYDANSPPAPNTDEWQIFYGEYRQDFDRYVEARERYFNVLAAELGDYARYITNS
ncbi:hypothetical protein FLO80_01785 [Aquicoccus porphyridii]|uniref:Uncharacterized protein n=1 Tax=Aquicoccus porphyridii TaxID=1852029 RepID=A0A5A9ZUQ6_9RHOB|nr:hypothetical protein [Aquicoccus porphyridii]KAA0920930.1 hypothetical protein FLO80_01785 [Aquicoccus porphyridii]RAI56531.1 hypothetical protein DOO74_01295 [Rhodobacteraceae bacterium AsT-22]